MKRSEIDKAIERGLAFLDKMGVRLPPQAYWDLETWHERGDEASELMKRNIGWDIVDFGYGRYRESGLLLYTLSNGLAGPGAGAAVDQPYANKLLVVMKDQVTVMHHHWSKMEDVIVLGGGELKLQLYNVGPRD